MSFITKKHEEIKIEKKSSLLGRLKKSTAAKIAMGATILATAWGGWELASRTADQTENNERAASIEYRIQNAKTHLPEEAFNIKASLNFGMATKAQLGEYQYFMGKCAHYLYSLTSDIDDNLAGRMSGQLDPVKRLSQMYKSLDQEIQEKGDDVLRSRGANGSSVEYILLTKVKSYLETLEPEIKSGKSRAERFDIAEGLAQSAKQKAQTAGNFRLNSPAPARSGVVADF